MDELNEWYDLTQYYDLSFSHEMEDEVEFIKAILEKHFGTSQKTRLLEPACGTGRLLFPLLDHGIDYTGFDINANAVDFLKRKIEKKNIKADAFLGDMTDFSIKGPKFDCAICTLDTFRHLMSETDSISHLRCVATHLKKNGIYILGLHLLPGNGFSEKTVPWETKRGALKLFTSISVMNVDRKKRIETLRISFRASRGKNLKKYRYIYRLRTYTYWQFNSLLEKAGCFEVMEAYNYSYDINDPVMLNQETEDVVLLLRKSRSLL